MAQEYVMLNNTIVRQPDEGLGYDFETTYTEDSPRAMNGTLYASAMFTVESFSYTASWLTREEMRVILQIVAKGKPFTLHYLSPFYGQWRDGQFYVGKGSLSVGRWIEAEERYESLSFNMIGVDPI